MRTTDIIERPQGSVTVKVRPLFRRMSHVDGCLAHDVLALALSSFGYFGRFATTTRRLSHQQNRHCASLTRPWGAKLLCHRHAASLPRYWPGAKGFLIVHSEVTHTRRLHYPRHYRWSDYYGAVCRPVWSSLVAQDASCKAPNSIRFLRLRETLCPLPAADNRLRP